MLPPSRIPFERASFWVQMYGLPLACMNLTVGQQIGSAMGHVEEVDVDEEGMEWGESLKVKINLDLQKPLMRGRMLKINGSSMLIKFQYERLPKVCFRCGVIKHGVTGCEERNEARKQNAPIEFGPWLRASSPKRVFGGRFGSTMGGREPPLRETGGGHGKFGPSRKQPPSRSRPPCRGQDVEGDSSGTAEDGPGTPMESKTRNYYCHSKNQRSGTKLAGDTMGGDLGADNNGAFKEKQSTVHPQETGAGLEEREDSPLNEGSSTYAEVEPGKETHDFLSELASGEKPMTDHVHGKGHGSSPTQLRKGEIRTTVH